MDKRPTMTDDGRPEAEKLWQTLDWLGLADELATRRVDRALRAAGLSFPQFALLSHFTQAPSRARTVTGIARALRANQPKISKRAQQLVESGLLEVRPSAVDRRIKELMITPAGRTAFRAAVSRLAPEVQIIFAEWDVEDVDTLNTLLFRLKSWLDRHRKDGGEAAENGDSDPAQDAPSTTSVRKR